ncbi:hypothetical protein ABPG74_004841, partial [Tetrahymena malaccensis]
MAVLLNSKKNSKQNLLYNNKILKEQKNKETFSFNLKNLNFNETLSQLKLSKLKNTLLFGKKIKLKKLQQNENAKTNKKKLQLLGGSDNNYQKIINSQLKYEEQDSSILEQTIKKKQQDKQQVQLHTKQQIEQRKIENDNDETQQHQENELNMLIQILYDKHLEIIERDQSIEIQKEPKKDVQKVELLQNSTNIQQIYIASKSSDYEDDYDSNQNQFPQFEQKGIQRLQTIKENLSSLQQNQKNKLINAQKNLKPECEQFLREMFQLGDHINSGGEADIFIHENDESIAYRVIQVKNDEDLDEQLLELQSIKVLNEQNILDLNVSHMLEDRINNNMYLIHVMQKCETSLQDEIIAKKPFSLDETLSFISTGFHLLIALRQKYIYHSDIKPGNILKVGDCNYKLSDFGASQKILFCDPFTEWKMATMAFIPKKQTLDLPFYHDIYSFGKTIEMSFKTNQGNELTQHIVDILENCQYLTDLDLELRKNLISLEGASILLQVIQNIKQLEVVNINLENNQIGVEEREMLIKTLKSPNEFKSFEIKFSSSENSSQNLDQYAQIPKKSTYAISFEKHSQFQDNPQINPNTEANQINLNLNYDQITDKNIFNASKELKNITLQDFYIKQSNQTQQNYLNLENDQNLNLQVEQLDLLLDFDLASVNVVQIMQIMDTIFQKYRSKIQFNKQNNSSKDLDDQAISTFTKNQLGKICINFHQ